MPMFLKYIKNQILSKPFLMLPSGWCPQHILCVWQRPVLLEQQLRGAKYFSVFKG
jgi:hypothetical protein